MSEALGTTTTHSSQYQAFLSKELLDRVREQIVLAQFGYKKSIPSKSGHKSITFHKPNAVSSSSVVTLTEGQTLNVYQDVDTSTITATLVQYGQQYAQSDISRASDWIDFVKLAKENLEIMFSEKMDDVIRDVLSAQTTGLEIRRANGAANWTTLNSNTASTAALSAKDVLAAATKLRKNKAKPIDGKNFVGVIAPQCEYDLMASTSASNVTWFDLNKYSNAEKIFNGEVGSIYGIRFVRHTNPFIATGSATAGDEYTYTGGTPSGGLTAGSAIYTTFILGRQAYGVPDLAGMGSFKPQVNVVDGADKADPLNQRTIVGGKAYYTACVLDNSFGIALKAKSSADFES